MAIVNVTPDSFADGGARFDAARAVAGGEELMAAGRRSPGHRRRVDAAGRSRRSMIEEEWRRVGPVIDGLRRRTNVPISIDTYKAEVAARAIDLGADIVNDISALTYDPSLAEVVARRRCGGHPDAQPRALQRTCMRVRGTRMSPRRSRASWPTVTARHARPASMPAASSSTRVSASRSGRSIRSLRSPVCPASPTLGRPIVVGPSRKSFLKAALGDAPPDERVWGTAAAVAASVLLGAHIVRVHDVAQMADVVRVADAIEGKGRGQRAKGQRQRE